MFKYIDFFSFEVPVYSICVYTGLIFVNIIAFIYLGTKKLNKIVFYSMEIIGGTSAIFGARFFVLFERCFYSIFCISNLDDGEKIGYAYYGGLFSLYLILFLCDKFLNVNFKIYAQEMIFLLPLLHAFWKIGCFCGGCCIGIPYNGSISIIYPEGVNELSGINCFPIQIIEALVSVFISLFLYFYKNYNKNKVIPMYLILYSFTRLFLEFFRYHQTKISFVYSLMLSCLCLVIGVFSYKMCLKKDVKDYE